MNSQYYAAVIAGVIVAKGSKPAMLKLVAKSGKAGPSTFLGVTSKPIGAQWAETKEATS